MRQGKHGGRFSTRREKLLREIFSFRDSPPENIRFIAGGMRALPPFVYGFSGLLLIIGGKELIRHWILNSERNVSAVETIPCMLIIAAAAMSVLVTLWQFLRPKIEVQGKSFCYRGQWYGCSEITEMKLTHSKRIQICTAEKRICSLAWAEDNAEMLIPWAHKLDIPIIDRRPRSSEPAVMAVAKIKNAVTQAMPQSRRAPAAKIFTAAQTSSQYEIAKEQYKNRPDITEFIVPDGVKVIRSKAFSGCVNLEKITLPTSLTEIEAYAFENCNALREIAIPEGVRTIGSRAFYECKALTHFKFPQSMRGTKIESGMFYNCISLETAVLPDRLSGNFENVFPNCESLRKIQLPDGIEAIGSFTFQYCELLETVNIPTTVKKIEYKAFLGCEELREIYIPDQVQSIDAYRTFARCKMLEKIRLPFNITFRHIFDEDSADAVGCCFAGCTALKTVILGSRKYTLDGPLNDEALRKMRGR